MGQACKRWVLASALVCALGGLVLMATDPVQHRESPPRRPSANPPPSGGRACRASGGGYGRNTAGRLAIVASRRRVAAVRLAGGFRGTRRPLHRRRSRPRGRPRPRTPMPPPPPR